MLLLVSKMKNTLQKLAMSRWNSFMAHMYRRESEKSVQREENFKNRELDARIQVKNFAGKNEALLVQCQTQGEKMLELSYVIQDKEVEITDLRTQLEHSALVEGTLRAEIDKQRLLATQERENVSKHN